ncbi:hypothetical protein D9757_011387 [Collybiopsis confluens]|uniref:FAD-binding PCMH-type domain-containing protein n=1 Tax=Collybiopsis confluens TaxID=2823264 RepID=A0A8H5LRK2_9AGAR|nr:hypothetical protein D9757_011387 [Collybiopsis confluens]
MRGLSCFSVSAFIALCYCSTAQAQNSSQSPASDPLLVTATAACTQISTSLGSSKVQSTISGPLYSLGANNAWSAFNREVNFQPTCIVFVNSTHDVQIAMKAIYKNNANYAVQSGGHSGMIGWNTIQNGVLISFLNMNATSYNPKKDTITMQPGIRWGDALNILEPHGVAATNSDVGTALLLGGGLSYLSPAYGYAADTYVSLDVVLVNGDMVTATVDNKYADLFKALKGGGNRFGIVTSYEVQAVHTGRESDKHFWGGIVLYPNSSIEALLPAIAHFAHSTSDTKAVLATDFIASWTNSSNPEITVQFEMYYNGTSDAFNQSFKELLSIPHTSASLGPLSYIDMIDLVNFPSGDGNIFSGSVLQGAQANSSSSAAIEDQYLETYRLFSNFTSTFASSTELNTALLSFTPVLESQIRIGYQKGGNAISPPQGKGGFNQILFALTFNEGVDQIPALIEQGREHWIAKTPVTPGLPLFLNEADANQDILQSYGEYNFLKKTFSKYDPSSFNVKHAQGPSGL